MPEDRSQTQPHMTRRNVFTRRCVCTVKPLHAYVLTNRSFHFFYEQKLLHRKSCCTEQFLQTNAFAHILLTNRCLYTERNRETVLTHRRLCAQKLSCRNFCAQMLLQGHPCTDKLLRPDTFTQLVFFTERFLHREFFGHKILTNRLCCTQQL